MIDLLTNTVNSAFSDNSNNKIQNGMLNLTIIKRDGTHQQGNIEKIHKPLFWAAKGLEKVSISAIEFELFNRLATKKIISSDQLHEELIEAARTCISEEMSDTDLLAGRLITYQVRKHAYGSYTPPLLLEIVKRNISNGRYTDEFFSKYSEEDWAHLDSIIEHSRDDLLRYAGAQQMRSKYLAKNRVDKSIWESFQVTYIMVPIVLYQDYPKETRLKFIKEAYDDLSLHRISLATPPMAGIRTRKKQFSSCVLIDSADTLESINATDSAATLYVASKAGLGINAGRNRGIGSSINKGDAVHTGVIPFVKKWTGSVKSCSQGGVRDGAVTFFFPIWHYEFPELVVLKDNTLLPEHTNISADYSFAISNYFYKRLIENKNITLFSPGEDETPGLYEAYYDPDQSKFAALYEKYEADSSIRKRVFPAADIFNKFGIQRGNTGRIYPMNVTNVLNGPFKVPIYQSNLCMEILLPTKPLTNVNDDNGEISLCTLGAINLGKVDKPQDLERPSKTLVRLLDEILDYQEYPVPAAEKATKNRRPLGIGIMGFAHFLAKRGLMYNEHSAAVVDQYAQAYSYYLIKASVDLAKEKGPCPGYKDTKYSDGWAPHLSRVPFLDTIVPHKDRHDWISLFEEMKLYGIRNSTLMAGMPVETSSQPSNETNGFQPARAPIVTKTSKDGAFTIVVPEFSELKDYYDWEWDQKSPRGYLTLMGFWQKYMDQAISSNTSYNPNHYPDGVITTQIIVGDMLYAAKVGLKTLYYNNTRKPGEDDFLKQLTEDGCSDGACKL